MAENKIQFPSQREEAVILRWLKIIDYKSAYGHDPELCRSVKVVIQALRGKRPGILP